MANNIDFLIPLMKDPAVLGWDPGSSASVLTNKVHKVLYIMKKDPAELQAKDVWEVVNDKDSQIRHKEERFGHFRRVASIKEQIDRRLKEVHPDLDLPDNPRISHNEGLVHDLSNAYVIHDGVFLKQEEKEWPLYIHADYLGVRLVSEGAVHNAYFTIPKLIHEGEGFAVHEPYHAWTAASRDPENPYSLGKIMKKFKPFILGKDRMSLITLTLADCLDNPNVKSHRVDLENMLPAFNARVIDDIARRTYHEKKSAGKPPTAFGLDLVEKGGLQRLQGYLTLVDDLLHDRHTDQYRAERPELWR